MPIYFGFSLYPDQRLEYSRCPIVLCWVLNRMHQMACEEYLLIASVWKYEMGVFLTAQGSKVTSGVASRWRSRLAEAGWEPTSLFYGSDISAVFDMYEQQLTKIIKWKRPYLPKFAHILLVYVQICTFQIVFTLHNFAQFCTLHIFRHASVSSTFLCQLVGGTFEFRLYDIDHTDIDHTRHWSHQTLITPDTRHQTLITPCAK